MTRKFASSDGGGRREGLRFFFDWTSSAIFFHEVFDKVHFVVVFDGAHLVEPFPKGVIVAVKSARQTAVVIIIPFHTGSKVAIDHFT